MGVAAAGSEGAKKRKTCLRVAKCGCELPTKKWVMGEIEIRKVVKKKKEQK